MMSKRRQFLSAAILFYLFLRRQPCLALSIDPPRPHYGSLKKEAKVGKETSPISVHRHLVLHILTVAAKFCTVEPR